MQNKLTCLIINLVFSLCVKAQMKPGFQVFYDSKSSAAFAEFDADATKPDFIVFKEQAKVAKQFAFIELKPILGIGNDDSFILQRSDADNLGFTHHRYQQHYKAIMVETGEFILHEKGNAVLHANGEFLSEIDLNVVPTISKENSILIAKAEIGALKYKWEITGEQKWHKQVSGNQQATLYPVPELVIIKNPDSESKNKYLLCWKMDIYAHEPMSRDFVYVDAQSGNVVKKINRICEFVSTGTALTKYSGWQTIKTDSLNASSFRLRDYSHAANIFTYDMNKGTNYGAAVDFTDNDNVWDSITNQDNAAYDAHHGAIATYEYFLNVHNRNSFNNAGAPLISYIHYSNNYNNAFWNGSVMTYGDGNGVTFSPLTTIDVCGHELTHGVTGNSSNLIYSYESGALNESFSDIFGTCVDFYALPGTANWLIGDQCYTPATSGDALRFMNNPNAASDPDTYLGSFWYSGTGDNGGVHINSGVQNFWFYLLTVGGVGTNDFGFNYNVTGLGINTAALIAYRNNNFYLTSGSQYSDARRYALQAAVDIFGPCSNEQLQTKNAWDAVGVNGPFNPNPLANAANTGIVCEGSSVTLMAAGGVSYTWSGPNGFNSTEQHPVLTNTTMANAGGYSVIATTNSGCSGTATTNVVLNAKPSLTGSAGDACPNVPVAMDAIAAAIGMGGPPLTTSNTNRISIPDQNTTGIESPMNVVSSGTAAELISIEIDSISHTWDADLSIRLVAPDNSTITLANGVGGSGDGFSHTIFSKAATNVIGSNGNNTAPFNGTYAPQQSFSNLTGSANGTWKIKVIDAYAQDTGSIWGWKITMSSNNIITTYEWSPALGLSSTTSQNPIASVSATSTYTVTVSDYIGCTNTATAEVQIHPLVSATYSTTDASCFGNNGTLFVSTSVGTAPVLFSVDGGVYSPIVSYSLPAGAHTLEAKDENLCNVASYPFSISEPLAVAATTTGANLKCYGQKNGTINLTATGGTGFYSYLWSNNKTTSSLSNLVAGTYTCTVTDANNCTTTVARTLTQPAQITMSFTKLDPTGPLFDNGSATCNPANGFTPYRYTWNTSPAQTTQTATGLSPGTYTVTVKDNKKCARNGAVVLVPARIASDKLISGSIQVSPNPTSGEFALLFVYEKSDQVSVTINDVTGRVVSEYVLLCREEANQFNFDISDFSNGVYFLRLNLNEKQETIRIIKQ
ncbi:MAG: M4 family metallopeptidase [Bacteroidetes bacterium]|nr:M4 family metallopeptidase [Bacteroidota bacterium]